MHPSNRRGFLKQATVSVGAVWGLTQTPMRVAAAEPPTNINRTMKIILAADPFALSLKKEIVQHLKEKGHQVLDLGATEDRSIPYYESCVTASRALQAGEGERAILLCGTGMGMATIANRFKGVTAAVVESVFAARMCRAINGANALCLGSMIWGGWMACEAVDTFLTTELTDGLPQFADFLREAYRKVQAIEPGK